MLNNTFKKSVELIMTTDEFDKVYKNASFSEKRKLNKFNDIISRFTKMGEKSISEIPIIPLVMSIDSADLWKDIYFHMQGMMDDDESAD